MFPWTPVSVLFRCLCRALRQDAGGTAYPAGARAVCRWLLVAACLWSPPNQAGAGGEPSYRLGIFAWRPAEILAPRFAPLGEYLSEVLSGARVEIVVLDQADLEKEIDAGRIDFLLTNPSHYLLLMHRGYFSAPLATVVNRENGVAVAKLGGVILVAPEREDIQRLTDLRGRRIAIPGRKFLGGYQTQAFELLEAGLRLPDDVQLLEVGSHDKVIDALLAGKADAGFVRTGLIEALRREGRTEVGRLRVLNAQQHTGFPFTVSTRLYPEWAFAAMPQVPEEVSKRITRALLLLEADHPAMQQAGIAGFTVPASYVPVEQLARALRLPPFERAEFHWWDVWQRYWLWITVVAGLTLLVSLLAALLWRQRGRLLDERSQLAIALEENRAVLEALGEGVYGVDRAGRCVFANARALQMLGLERASLIGADAHRLFHQRGRASGADGCHLHRSLTSGQPLKADDIFVHADGSTFPVHVNVQPMWRDGLVVGAVVAFHDIRERLRLMRELEILASHDALTGLVNRREFFARMSKELARMQRHAGVAGLLMVDIDHFKRINDSYGHAVGDQVLRTLAAVFLANLREQDTAGRLGGEEFACLLPQTSLEEALRVAERLRTSVAATNVTLEDASSVSEPAPAAELYVTVSIGVAVCRGGDLAEQVLARADAALYRAKADGRNRVVAAAGG